MGLYYAGLCSSLDRAFLGLRFSQLSPNIDFSFSHADTMWSVQLVKGGSIWNSEMKQLICVVQVKKG